MYRANDDMDMDFDDEELGQFEMLIPALAPIAGQLLGGLTGGGGGAGGAGGIPQMLSQVLGGLGGAVGGGGGGSALNPDVLRAIVTEVISAVPPPVREQVQQVIDSVRAQSGTLADAGREITQQIGTEFQPQIATALSALQLARQQTDATQEHRSIVRDDERWRGVQDRDSQMLAKLDSIATRLGAPGTAVVQGEARIRMLGGRDLLQGE